MPAIQESPGSNRAVAGNQFLTFKLGNKGMWH